MQTIYQIDDSIKDKCLIDKHVISGKRISSFDEYCLYFPLSRQLVYKHLKYSTEPVKLSYLHNRYYEQIGSFWKYNAKEISENQTIYARVINNNVRDDISWKSFGSLLGAVYFDKTKLLYQRAVQVASDAVDECFEKNNKHWSLHLTTLLSDDPIKISTYQIERMQRIRNVFDNIILHNIHKSDLLHISYAYDRVDCTTNDGFTFRILIGAFEHTNSFIDINIISDRGMISDESRKNLMIAKIVSHYPEIGHIIENLENNAHTILTYLSDFDELFNNYAYITNQYQLVLNTIFSELRDSDTTSNFASKQLQFIAVNPNSIQILKCHFNKLNKLQYNRTTYIIKNGKVDSILKSHIKTSFADADFDKLSKHLIKYGFINIHIAHSDIDINDYIHLTDINTINFGHSIFKSTYSEQSSSLHKYLKLYHQHIIDKYHKNELDQNRIEPEHSIQTAYINYFDYRKKLESPEKFNSTIHILTKNRNEFIQRFIVPYITKHESLQHLLNIIRL